MAAGDLFMMMLRRIDGGSVLAQLDDMAVEMAREVDARGVKAGMSLDIGVQPAKRGGQVKVTAKPKLKIPPPAPPRSNDVCHAGRLSRCRRSTPDQARPEARRWRVGRSADRPQDALTHLTSQQGITHGHQSG